MKASFVLSVAFAVGTVVLGYWVLTRPRARYAEGADAAGSAGEPEVDETRTFAMWAVASNAVLLAELEADGKVRRVPARFRILDVSAELHGAVSTSLEPQSYSWALADRDATVEALHERGFPVTHEEVPYPPVLDLLSAEAPAPPAKGAEPADTQALELRSKDGLTAKLRRTRSDPQSSIVWNRRALGFPSTDKRLVYVVPDDTVIPLAPGGAP